MYRQLLLCQCFNYFFSNFITSYLYSAEFRGPSPLWYEPIMTHHSFHLINSLYEYTGEQLVDIKLLEENPTVAAKELFFLSNRVVASCGIQSESLGPILNFGNAEALKLWGASWEQFTSMYGAHTADVDNRDKRQAFLDSLQMRGYATGYSGVRITLDGRRFRIFDATVWNVVENGNMFGQAATFGHWEFL